VASRAADYGYGTGFTARPDPLNTSMGSITKNPQDKSFTTVLSD
jgi:hypothetical protein